MAPKIKKSKKNIKVIKKSKNSTEIKKKALLRKNNNKSDEQCKNWLIEQREQHYDPIDDYNEQETADSEDSEKEDCVKTLQTLKHRGKYFKPKSDVLFECEWEDCKMEIPDEKFYLEHVGNHAETYTLYVGQDMYKCKWNLCTYSTLKSESFSRHVHYHGYHTRIKTYGESLRYNIDLPRCSNDSRARNIIENPDNDFICHWKSCTQSINSVNLFFDHVNHHVTYANWYKNTEKKKIRCRWGICKKIFLNEYRLMEHVRSHTKQKNVGCHHCGVMFCSNSKFIDHCKRQLTSSSEYQCTHCFKYYASERILKDHLRNHINCHKCSLCDMTCSSIAKLSQHVRYKHLPVKPYKCDLCKFTTVMKVDLERHKNVHLKDIIECEVFGCNYTCRSLYVLRRHDLKVHQKFTNIYACHCCNREFDMGLKLSKHLIKVHKFHYPSGESRFKYKLDANGYFRLQTTRIESLEVTKQIISTRNCYVEAEHVVDDKESNTEPEIIEDPKKKLKEPVKRITSIYDFKVMKKYLTDKSIVIDVEEVDEKGVVVKSETIVTKELCLPNAIC